MCDTYIFKNYWPWPNCKGILLYYILHIALTLVLIKIFFLDSERRDEVYGFKIMYFCSSNYYFFVLFLYMCIFVDVCLYNHICVHFWAEILDLIFCVASLWIRNWSPILHIVHFSNLTVIFLVNTNKISKEITPNESGTNL